jgi:predicted sulfurtransferase
MMPTHPQNRYLNAATYRFVEFESEQLAALRSLIREACVSNALRGTILLSTEGINASICGPPEGVQKVQRFLRTLPHLGGLEFRESWSAEYVFNRMLVKIKKELIPLGSDATAPPHTAPYIEPADLKKLIDDRRDFVLLDVRNGYEVNVGTFEGALDLQLSNFRQLPQRLATLDRDLKHRTLVTFCTGGIRCEKATAVMMEHGFENVLQLKGGILRYFQECGDDHFRGECFVFDKRVAVNSRLEEADLEQCYNCRHVLTPEDRLSDYYEFGVSCAHCSPSRTRPNATQEK